MKQSILLTMQQARRWSILSVLPVIVSIATTHYTSVTIPFVQGYSWGAGSCDSGGAVGGYHLESYDGQRDGDTSVPNGEIRCIQTGTLGSAGFVVTVGDQMIASDTQMVETLQYNVDYEVQIYRLTSVFRGLLLRLSSADSNSIDLTGKIYTTDPLLQMATTACATPTIAVGVTHRSAIDKDLVYAYLRFDSEQNVTSKTTHYNLGITVVGMNSENGSVYSYSSYPLQISGTPTKEYGVLVGSNMEYGAVDDNYVPEQDVSKYDESGDDVPSKTADEANVRSRDSGQSSSLVIGFTSMGGACIAALFALALRAKVRRARAQCTPT